MWSLSVLCLSGMVAAGVLLDAGSALPMTLYRWKILSQATGKFVGVTESREVRGDASYENATIFYLQYHDGKSVLGSLETVSKTGAPKLYLNIESKTGKLQASPNHDALKNTVFQIVQPNASTIQLIMNVTFPCPIDEGSGVRQGEIEALSLAEPCTVVKECGVAFNGKESTPIQCQDQSREDSSRNLSFRLHLPTFHRSWP